MTGAAWYCGTSLDEASMTALVDRIRLEAGVEPALPAPAGVEAVRRSSDGRSYLFVLNHNSAAVTVRARGFDLVGEAGVDGELTLAPGGCALVRETG